MLGVIMVLCQDNTNVMGFRLDSNRFEYYIYAAKFPLRQIFFTRGPSISVCVWPGLIFLSEFSLRESPSAPSKCFLFIFLLFTHSKEKTRPFPRHLAL